MGRGGKKLMAESAFTCSMVLQQLKLRGEITLLDFHFLEHFADLNSLRE